MSSLYILGNGFDLSHGLPTKYDPDLRRVIEKYGAKNRTAQLIKQMYFSKTYSCDNANRRYLLDRGISEILNTELQEDEGLWRVFESRLGTVSKDVLNKLQDTLENNEDCYNACVGDWRNLAPNSDNEGEAYEWDTAYQNLENTRDRYIADFNALIDDIIDIPETINQGIEEMVKLANSLLPNTRPEFNFEQDSYFLTFNYTDTLETLYNISDNQVLHIHGRLNQENPNIVFGNMPDRITAVNNIEPARGFHEIEDICVINTTCILPQTPEAWQKGMQVDHNQLYQDLVQAFNCTNKELIKQVTVEDLETFLCEAKIDKFIIIGHSLSEVDLKYFQWLIGEFPYAKWLVSYHRCSERKEFAHKLEKLGLTKLQYKLICVEDLKL